MTHAIIAPPQTHLGIFRLLPAGDIVEHDATAVNVV